MTHSPPPLVTHTLLVLISLCLGLSCNDRANEFPPNGAIGGFTGPNVSVNPGDILISMGAYSSTTGYTPFTSHEDEMEVAEGIQGGVWVMPALRAAGCDAKVLVDATITTENGEVVGLADTRVKLFDAEDGWLEIQYLPIKIQREDAFADEDVFDILGLRAIVEIHLSDDSGNAGSFSIDVILVDGVFFGSS